MKGTRKEVNMDTNIGIQNEENFVRCINNKSYDELNKHLQFFLQFLFPVIDTSKKFHCELTHNYIKPDICISLDSEMRYVSLKYGQSDVFHNENILTFVEFLRKNGISEQSINTYLLYHYGDGTTNGTGKHRLSSVELRFHYKEELDKLNQELNKDKEFVKKFIDRAMFQGVNDLANRADYLYHGDTDYGVFLSRYQLMQRVETKNYSFMTECIHIGPLVIRPHARYSNKPIQNNRSRELVEASYPKIVQSIMFIFPKFPFSENITWNVSRHR